MLNRLNLILAIVMALVLVLLLQMRIDHSRPNFQVQLGDDMTYSPAYTSYEANHNFPSGRTMQSPVPGTIARGTMPLHFEATPAEAIRAGEELVNPFDHTTAAGTQSIERGKLAFQYFCVVCHGSDGAGNGPVAKRGFPPPPSLLTGKSLQMKDGQLLHILTYGQNSMPKFAAQLPIDRRWDVINYIRSLQVTSPVVIAQSPEPQSPLPSVESPVSSSETAPAPGTSPGPKSTSQPEPADKTDPESKTELTIVSNPTTEPEASTEATKSTKADTEQKP